MHRQEINYNSYSYSVRTIVVIPSVCVSNGSLLQTTLWKELHIQRENPLLVLFKQGLLLLITAFWRREVFKCHIFFIRDGRGGFWKEGLRSGCVFWISGCGAVVHVSCTRRWVRRLYIGTWSRGGWDIQMGGWGTLQWLCLLIASWRREVFRRRVFVIRDGRNRYWGEGLRSGHVLNEEG